MNDWEEVGFCWVDSGSIMLADPCYMSTRDASHTVDTWDEFLKLTWPKDFGNGQGPSVYDKASNALQQPGLGVIVSSGYGDGEYPVYVKRNEEGRIAEARIVFIGDEDDQ